MVFEVEWLVQQSHVSCTTVGAEELVRAKPMDEKIVVHTESDPGSGKELVRAKVRYEGVVLLATENGTAS